MINTVNTFDIKEIPQHNKIIYNIPFINVTLNGENLKAFFVNPGK